MRRLLLLTLATSLLGCGPQVRRPNLLHPGNLASQQFDAIYHDPYPLNDIGPEVVGGRPLGYEAPVPEVRRARQYTPPTRQLAPPPAYTPVN